MKKLLPALFLAAAFSASAQSVTLDETFNIGTGTNFNVFRIEELSGGKIMIAGNFDVYNGTPAHGIARINSDGSIDTSFNAGFGGNLVVDFVIEENGKVVIVSEMGGIMRLNADGTIDNAFTAQLGQVVSSVVKQGDKYIVTGNFQRYSSEATMYQNLIRLNSDGSIDGTFPGALLYSEYASILQQEDGKLLLTGTFSQYNDTPVNNIMRLNPDGSLDETFDTGTGANGWIRGTAQQPDGKYIIAGAFTNFDGHPAKQMVRLNTDGSVDTTFAYTSNGVGLPEDGIVGFDVVVQEDGKILIGGRFLDTMEDIEGNPDGSVPVHLVRLNTNGSIDTSFTIMGEGFNDTVYAIALEDDEKMYVGGQFTEFNGAAQNNLARLIIEVLGAQNYTADNLMLYPNPFQERLFTTNTSDTATIKLTDVTGKVIRNTTPISREGIDVSGLAQGIYFAEITSGEKTEIKKIIKE